MESVHASRLKILMVTEALGAGVLSALADICNHLDSRHFDVVLVYSRRSETPPEPELRRIFLSHVRLLHVQGQREIHPVADAMTLWRYVHLLRTERPDVVHFHSSKAGFLGRIAARIASIPRRSVFYSPHGFAFLRLDVPAWKKSAFTVLEKIAGLAGGTIVAVSSSEAEYARTLVGPERTVLVENGLDLEALQAKVPPLSEAVSAQRFVVGTAGRISFQKDPFAFLELARRILDKYPQSRFLWIGGGELQTEFLQRARELGLGEVVQATGWVSREQAWTYLRDQVGIYVQTSLWEGLPITLLEAMVYSKPIVARDAVGNRDAIEHEITGFVAHDISEMTEYVGKLISQPPLAVRMGAAGRLRLERRYTLGRVIEQLQAIYLGRTSGTTIDQ